MRKSARDVYDLVASLTAAEKRHFSMQTAARHQPSRTNKYMLLFQLLDRMKEYDEDRIAREASELGIHDLPGLKTYLYDTILDVLHKHSSLLSSSDDKVKTWLRQVAVLFRKGLFEQCRIVLAKARRLAESTEMFDALQKIISWEIQLLHHTAASAEVWHKVEDFYDEMLTVLEQQTNFLQIDRLASRFFALEMTDGRLREGRQLQALRQIIDEDLLRGDARVLSRTARYHFYDIHMRYRRILGDDEQTYKYARLKVQLFESQPEFAAHHAYRHIYSYGHLLMECLKLERFEEFRQAHAELVRLGRKYRQHTLVAEECAYYVDLWYAIRTADLDRIPAKVQGLSEWLRQASGRIEIATELSMYYSMAYALLLCEQFDDALHWITTFLNHSSSAVMGDLAGFARLLNLIVHYELGNTMVLEHQLRATYRYLLRKQRGYKLEVVLLSFLRRLTSVSSGTTNLIREFRRVREEIRALANDRYERQGLEYFEFDIWLQSRIEGRSFAEVYRAARQDGAETKVYRKAAGIEYV